MSGSNTKFSSSADNLLIQSSPSTQELIMLHHDKVKDMIWIIEGLVVKDCREIAIYLTGFSISHGGFIMTCYHPFYDVKIRRIRVRRLNEDGFVHKAEVNYIKKTWDMMLLKVVDDVKDFNIGVLADDGSLLEGEHLWHIGHPSNFVGSVLAGRVAYPCVNNAILPDDSQSCRHYRSNYLTNTPPYRVMGDLVEAVRNDYDRLDSEILESDSDILLSCMMDFHPLILMIQCNGLVGGDGCSGGPVFNTHGEVVGMLVMNFCGFDFAIHVSMLRKFLNEALKSIGEPSNNDEKDLKRKHLSDPSDEEIEDVPIE